MSLKIKLDRNRARISVRVISSAIVSQFDVNNSRSYRVVVAADRNHVRDNNHSLKFKSGFTAITKVIWTFKE
ncbi:MAG: hypothetical protein QNJ47_01775 [Nostocaceae cyanobacterium]|nr:hypothetical protein [Nostocaceae cyanobacterium]